MIVPTNPATPGKFGIDEVRDVVRFAARLTRAIRAAMADGKVNLRDIRYLFSVIPAIKPALDGFRQVKDEVLDLSPDELADLAQLFAQEADIPHTSRLQDQLQHELKKGDGLIGMVVATTQISQATGVDGLPLSTK